MQINEIHHYYTRNLAGPHRNKIKSSLVMKSFLVESLRVWRILPANVKESNNVKIFTKRAKYFLNVHI